jgi:hypothetical protein
MHNIKRLLVSYTCSECPCPPTEDKIDDVKNTFYEKSQRVFDRFSTYYMIILLGDFSAKVDREEHFKGTSINNFGRLLMG